MVWQFFQESLFMSSQELPKPADCRPQLTVSQNATLKQKMVRSSPQDRRADLHCHRTQTSSKALQTDAPDTLATSHPEPIPSLPFPREATLRRPAQIVDFIIALPARRRRADGVMPAGAVRRQACAATMIQQVPDQDQAVVATGRERPSSVG